jgi:hypothetical protein
MPSSKTPGGKLTYAQIFQRNTDGGWTYGTHDGTLDPRMVAAFKHVLDTWPSMSRPTPWSVLSVAANSRATIFPPPSW